ncbi:MAG: hypothetical protein ABWZ55_11780 [Acidimicrobiales bacterium]
MDDGDGERPRYPTWVRVALVALQALGVIGGLVLGVLTYDAWSQPDDPEVSTTTTTVVSPETAVPPATLG